MTGEYVAPKYREETHKAADDESAVGYPDLARSISRARYDVELHNVARAREAAGVSRPDRVLEVGSGTGIWIDFWRERGAQEVAGVDLTNVAVERLTTRYQTRIPATRHRLYERVVVRRNGRSLGHEGASAHHRRSAL
jgi:ubiquinone/menaquinone biosynthesis C-methylase UbiE